MKKTYEHPEISIVLFMTDEILQTSAEKDPFVEDPFDVIA